MLGAQRGLRPGGAVYFYQLRTFLAVARLQGISKALGDLGLTQSAVSRQIQNL